VSSKYKVFIVGYSKLIVVEKRQQITALIKYADVDSIFLSLSPDVGLKLKQKKLKYIDTLQYFTAEDHASAVLSSQSIMNILREQYTVSEDMFCNESYKVTSFFHLRSIVNYIYLTLSIIDNVSKDIDPSEIIISGDYYNDLFSSLGVSDNLFIEIINEYCKVNSINVSCYSHSDNNKKSKRKKLIASLVLKALSEAQMIIFHLFYKNKKIIAGTGFEYNINRAVDDVSGVVEGAVRLYISPRCRDVIDNVMDFVKGRTYFFCHIPSGFSFRKSAVVKTYSALMDSYAELIYKNKILFNVRGVFIGKYILDYFNGPLFEEVKRVEYYNNFVSRLLSSNNVATVFAPHNVGLNAAIGVQCKKNNIPAFVISHGTATKQSGVAMIEWCEHSRYIMGEVFPYIAAQTKTQMEFLEDRNGTGSEVIEVCSMIYADIERYDKGELKNKLYGNDGNRIIVVHAGTPSIPSFFVPWIYETTEEYVSNINDIIEALKYVPDVYLVVKVRKKHFQGLCESDINDLFVSSDNSSIKLDGDFEEYLATADLLVSYSSTTIEESLYMKVPVLQYDPFRRYQHIKAETVNGDATKLSPVYFVHDRKKLISSIQWVVDNHINSRMKNEIDWSKYNDLKDKGLSDIVNIVDGAL